ncbi:lipopolysaccharide biosynthesis protein [Cypionkella sp.]|uniref:lipopolysaccharide biosynthesis protein n=1 Tax=Cypionkella sp. TaxID=2811411 RepID=UPI002721157A|nr:hypothetical protein [Cypionkella sp.]MDO8982377.1 hypothetical protein [Cypionkella sp.]MDP1577088.1 hypothetical protein [Cypionkella sp.]MDP2050627.1 hypothetical protein [Cypionkella sp.]
MAKLSAQIAQYRYVLVNTLVSVVAFARNMMFMATLGLADLGQMALLQTIVMLVGFVQLGMINGAFVLFAEDKVEQTRRVANALHLGIALLAVLAALVALAGQEWLLIPVVAPETLIIGVFAGLATLASTWMNNLLIAKKALGHSNLINIAAVTVSLVAAAASLRFGLTAALASMLLQPVLVAVGALIVEPLSRPNPKRPDAATLRLMWSLGIMQFLGGLSLLLTYQIERWSITLLLGDAQLGQFYLVMMFTTFFQLVPAALLNVHLPQTVQADSRDRLAQVLRRHLKEVMVYGIAVLLVTVALVPTAVRLLVPQFEPSIPLLLLAIPSLIIMLQRDNATLALYASRRMRPMLVSGIILLVCYSAVLGLIVMLGLFSLQAVVIARTVAVAVSAVYLYWQYRVIMAERGKGSWRRRSKG